MKFCKVSPKQNVFLWLKPFSILLGGRGVERQSWTEWHSLGSCLGNPGARACASPLQSQQELEVMKRMPSVCDSYKGAGWRGVECPEGGMLSCEGLKENVVIWGAGTISLPLED